MRLSLHHLSCGYTKRAVLADVCLDLNAGDFLCVLGPNGAGKSALLRTITGVMDPLGGSVLVDGLPLSSLSPARRAWCVAYVPQAHAPLFAFRVLDVVAMGRTARWPLWSGPTRADWSAAECALSAVGIAHFAEHRYTELSGGERQLVLIARALAQEARLLVLDEPAASLDFGNQVKVLRTLRGLAVEGFGVLMATHHPEHAMRCASRVALVRGGTVHDLGPPAVGLTPELLRETYGLDFVLTTVGDARGNSIPLCAPCLD